MSTRTGGALRLAGAACDTCPARDGLCVPPEKALTPGRVRLAVVGEVPARQDAAEGRIFGGGAGRMLGRGLRTLGLARSDVHWTNAVLCDCKPRDWPKARKACAERLRRELAAVAPQAIMPLGPMSLQSSAALPRKPQILKWRGSVSEIELRGANGASRSWVLPTIHPTFVARAPKWGPTLEIDVARVGRVLRDGFVAPEDAPGRRLIVPKTLDALDVALALLEPGADVSGDVETVGLGPTRTALVCQGFSDGTTTIVLPHSKASNGIEPFWGFPDRVVERVNNMWAQHRCITHNGPAFDHIVFARYGFKIGKWGDTLLASHATAGHMPKNLAHVVTQILDVPPWKQLEDRGVDIERLWHYNARDCLYTILAWNLLKGQIT